jgi:hypothetical protein
MAVLFGTVLLGVDRGRSDVAHGTDRAVAAGGRRSQAR